MRSLEVMKRIETLATEKKSEIADNNTRLPPAL
jgi:hypothetical protein